jgi:tetratricopeptide (TPR) repeat protein
MVQPNPEFRHLVAEAEYLYATKRRSIEALHKIERALLLRPLDAHALVVKGRVLFSLGYLDQAWQLFTKIGRHKAEPEALLERARILYALKGKNRQALEESAS